MKPNKQILRFQRLLERGDTTYSYYVVYDDQYADIETFASTVRNFGVRASVTWSDTKEGRKRAEIKVQQRIWSAFLLYQKSPAVRLYAAMAQGT